MISDHVTFQVFRNVAPASTLLQSWMVTSSIYFAALHGMGIGVLVGGIGVLTGGADVNVGIGVFVGSGVLVAPGSTGTLAVLVGAICVNCPTIVS